ncbi:hypothetical protein [Acidisoma cladoniae]|jgi:hypothetical protein|uniref:hypothetical protein n=1 Tax=Acidisoma cladoniae TaxID=3040935 RepID=UPI00254A491F|nr:hypothetical protein [Acidisoma sp. PAMC 29798]
MAKAPGGPPKGKAAAPAQFDMNSRERKSGGGGKGRPGGPGGPGGRGRDEKRAPSRIVTLPPATVDRGAGWIIEKVGKVEQTTNTAMGAEYRLIFEGHDPLAFDYLSAARERAKEGPPETEKTAEKEPAEDVAADPAAEEI